MDLTILDIYQDVREGQLLPHLIKKRVGQQESPSTNEEVLKTWPLPPSLTRFTVWDVALEASPSPRHGQAMREIPAEPVVL